MDASKKGLGTCLIQKGKVICYASRALTKTEQNYQNLEREALGTIWGMEKPGVWKVSATHRHYPGTAPFPMAHIGSRFVLLEKNGHPDSGRCILKMHHSEEIAKFYFSSCVHGTIYDCNRIRPTPHNQK